MTLGAPRPDVSIVIPTRNRHERLHRTLQSALSQEDVEIEVIVVDDGSHDQTPAYLQSHPDPRVTTISHPSAAGVAAARNSGIAEARAPWIAMLDDDDLWSPRKLRDQLDAASEQGGEWVYSSVIGVDDALRVVYALPAPPCESLLEQLLADNVLGGGASNVCATRALLIAVGGFDEHLKHLADWDLWIRLAAVSTPACSSSVHTAYVLHSDSMVLGCGHEPESEVRYIIEKHQRLLSQHPEVAVDRAALSGWIAWSHVRSGRRREAVGMYLASAARHRSVGHLRAGLTLLRPQRSRASSGLTGDDLEPSWLRAHHPWLSESTK